MMMIQNRNKKWWEKEGLLGAKYFSTTALSFILMLVGLFAVMQLQATVVVAQEETDTTSTESVAQVPADYSYTVQAGDGVTNLILDAASAAGVEITPAQAYDIARSNGSAFLDSGVTKLTGAPYTAGIGGFPEVGAVVSSSSFGDLFAGINDALNQVVAGETPAPAEGTDNLGEDSSTANEETSEDATADEEDASDEASGNTDSEDESGLSPLAIIIGIVGVAAVAYYLFGRSEQ